MTLDSSHSNRGSSAAHLALSASLGGVLCSVVLFGAAWTLKPNLYAPPHIQIAPGLSVTVTELWGAELVIYTGSAPYIGGSLGSARVSGWDSIGLYFRCVKPTGSRPYWTFTMSLWYPLGVSISLACVSLLMCFRSRGRQSPPP
jgi:hypothetical protein